MLRTLSIFVAERFRLSVSLPVSFLLCVATVERPWDGSCLRLSLCIWLILFCARAVDDIADLPVDRQRRPGRALPAGTITTRKLGWLAALALAAALLLLAYRSVAACIAVVANSLLVVWFYSARSRLPHALRPLLVNAVFFTMVLLGPLERAETTVHSVLLAAFVWMGVVGHDFSHSIEESRADRLHASPSPAGQARWGAAFFAGASIVGGVFAVHARDAYFAIALVATSLWIARLLRELLRNPSDAAAGRIYVPGFLYFLLPLVARIATGWFG